jgi:exodeoxyribonuclease VII large subunit
LHAALATSARRRLISNRQALAAERRALETFRPGAYLATERERTGLLLDRATRALRARLAADRSLFAGRGQRLAATLLAQVASARAELTRQEAGLVALDPFATLERGYAIVRAADGRVVVDATTQQPGGKLDVRLARGGLDVIVDAVRDSGA